MASGTVQFIIQTSASTVQIQAYGGAMASLVPTAQNASAKTVTAFTRVEAILKKMQSAVIGFVGAFVFLQAIRGIKEIIQAGIDFESSFVGIRKTVDGSIGQFALLSNQMRQLAKYIGTPVDDLNRIGQAAGQLGIEIGNIKEFVSTIAKVGIATGMATDEAALNFGRLTSILQEPIGNVKVLASTMFALDKNAAASAEEILLFSMNIGAAAKNVNMT